MSLASASSLPTSGRTPADGDDGHDGRTAQSDQQIGKGLQARRARGNPGGVLELGHEVVVGQEEPVDGTVEDDDLDVLVGLQSRDDALRVPESTPGQRC